MAKKLPRFRRTFTPRFKKDAVALVEDGGSVNEVAHDLGIARSLLQRWRTQLRREPEVPFPGTGRLAPQAEQIRQLQQRLRAVTEERDIPTKPWGTSRTTRSAVPLHCRVPRRGPPGDLRVHRRFLQSHSPAFDQRLSLTRRAGSAVRRPWSVTPCPLFLG